MSSMYSTDETASSPSTQPSDSRRGRGWRHVAVVALAGLCLGVTAPLAEATESHHSRAAHHAVTAAPFGTLPYDPPPVVEEGLDDRIADLPEEATTEQVVDAMYPGDQTAQGQVLDFLQQTADDNGSDDPETAQAKAIQIRSWWSKGWHWAKCVATASAVIAGNWLVITKAKRSGGVIKALRKVFGKKGTREQRLKVAIAAFGDFTGVNQIVSACKP